GLVLQTKSNDETRRRLNSMVSAGFIKSTSAGNLGSDGDGKLEIARRTVASGLQHNAADITFGLVICLDVIFNIVDIDSRAGGGTTPLWAEIGSVTCLAGYTLEFLLKFFVSGRKLFKDVWSVADLCIICSGIFEVILTACGIPAGSVTLLRLLRLLRIIRLMKLCRQFRWLSELRKLMMMMASCLRTLFWSFLFCFIVMSAWSMAAVELINPLVQQMAAEGVFDSCRTCRSSLTSVMRANLMMFQTIIAGDSWGQLAVPVIEAHPWTAIIFIGSLLTLVFGVLNMIVAVVVDTFAEHRQRDVMNLAEEMDSDAAEDRRFLQKIFDQIDEDGSGELSLEELMSGARTVPEFQGRLRVMDIDENDLVQMFEMIDGDGSGSVDPEEFINTLNRWANDSKTAARFVKYQMMRSIAEQEELKSLVVSKLESLEKSLKKPSQKRRKDGKRPTPGPLDVLVEVEGDESTSTSHFRPQESQDSFMVSVDEDVEEFHVGGSGELAEDRKVEGSESEALPTLAGAGRRYGSFLGRRQQAGFCFPDDCFCCCWRQQHTTTNNNNNNSNNNEQ
ncbi:unnamed protein product, partial [Polarella glacialis]